MVDAYHMYSGLENGEWVLAWYSTVIKKTSSHALLNTSKFSTEKYSFTSTYTLDTQKIVQLQCSLSYVLYWYENFILTATVSTMMMQKYIVFFFRKKLMNTKLERNLSFVAARKLWNHFKVS